MDNTAIQQLVAVSPLAWADFGKLSLGGSTFQTSGFEFLHEPYQCEAQRQCVCKATQMGWTQKEVIKALHGCIHGKYPKGVLYLFPTRDDVNDFSSSRFKPMLTDNPVIIGQHVSETDRTNLKRIGDAFLFFRGARLGNRAESGVKKGQQLKSIPTDKAVFDELDEMDQAAIPLALARMADSPVKEESYLGNPTIPDYGIDKKFKESDQRHWMIKCESCGKDTCLEIEFPDCLKKKSGKTSTATNVINLAEAGKIYRACIKCGAEIYPKNGVWVPQKPELTKDMVGYTISHLNARHVDPGVILEKFNKATEENDQSALTEFYNLIMGKAYIAAENRLTLNDVYNCCGHDPMMVSHSGPCAAGVDVGKLLHVVIGHRFGEHGIKVVKLARVSSFNDVHDLFTRFHVNAAVFDLYPETRKVREFCESHRGAFVGCAYNENQRGVAAWNAADMIVQVNRTEICDASHDIVVKPGRLELPRQNDEVKEYAAEMTQIAKILEEDKETGQRKYTYKKLGADHYRHATNYLLLASTRIAAVARSTDGNQAVEPVKYYY